MKKVKTIAEIKHKDKILANADKLVKTVLGKSWTFDKHCELKGKILAVID